MTDPTLPAPTTKPPWLGLPIGVNDRNGNPIHIGDVLHFDPAEWGSDDHYFCVEFSAGKVHHPGGGASDLTEWCVIVRKWDAPTKIWEDFGALEVRFGLNREQRAKIAKALAQDADWREIAYELGWEVETLKQYYRMDSTP